MGWYELYWSIRMGTSGRLLWMLKWIFGFYKMLGKSWVADQLAVSREGLSSMKLVLVTRVTWPPLWSSSQISWLQIQRSGFDSRRYHIFWEVVGLERGPLSLVSTIEELLAQKSSYSSLEIREYSPMESVTLTTWQPTAAKVVINFSDKRRSLGRCSSLADSGRGV
jgi:hypothetical protein